MATKSTNKLYEWIKFAYYPLRNSLVVYKYVMNFIHVLKWQKFKYKFKTNKTSLNQRILNDLKTEGIAFANLEEICPGENYLKKMQEWVFSNEKNLRPKTKKKFLLSYFSREDNFVELDLNNVFFNFYLNEKLIFLVSSYLGYVPQLNFITVEKTIPIEKSVGSSHSQNWHRDPEERKTLKVFIYISDVNNDNGPFVYVKQSQPSGKGIFSKFAPQKLPYGSYPDEKLVSAKVKENDMVTATGKAGTVIFCDTAGLHRGGLSFSGERIMATGFYPSKKWSESPLINLPANFDEKGLNTLAINVISNLE